LSYGPVFHTPTKPQLQPSGFSYLPEMKKIGLPFFPIGGINLQNVGQLISRGVRKAVVCSAILCSKDPEAETRRIKRKLSSSPSP
jgi:thiamine-phosphate pyrophosphorylase